MNKIKIKSSEYKSLKKHLNEQVEYNNLNNEQVENILNTYEIKKINMVYILTLIGIFFLGCGFILLGTTYWSEIGKYTKLFAMFFALILTVLISYVLKDNHPKTSKSLLYGNILIFIGMIYFITALFNLELEFSTVIIISIIYSIPILLEVKNVALYICILIGMLGAYSDGIFGLIGVTLMVLIIYFIELNVSKYKESKVALFVKLGVYLYYLTRFMYEYIKINTTIIHSSLLLILGITLYVIKINKNKDVYKLIGLLLIGIEGQIFIYELSYNILESDILSYILIIPLLIFFIINSSKGSKLSMLFIVSIIFRYLELSAPLVILLGIIFLVIGYKLETKKKGREDNEKE